jgi:hypothetical protein
VRGAWKSSELSVRRRNYDPVSATGNVAYRKIFDEAGIAAELEAYLPLVPDGGNLKATCRSRMKRNETERRISVNAVDRR